MSISEPFQLVGAGACHGPKWDDGDWPIHVGDKSIAECGQLCQKNKGCTSFSLGKAKGPKKPCLLYHHTNIETNKIQGIECYKLTGKFFQELFFEYANFNVSKSCLVFKIQRNIPVNRHKKYLKVGTLNL